MTEKLAHIILAGLANDLEISLQTNQAGVLDLCFKDLNTGKTSKLSIAGFPKDKQAELDRYKHIALRSVADLDNYRWRIASERKQAESSDAGSVDAVVSRIRLHEGRRGFQLLSALKSIVENHLRECPEIGTIGIPYDTGEDDWEFILTHFCENLTQAVIEKRVAQCVERLQAAKTGVSFT